MSARPPATSSHARVTAALAGVALVAALSACAEEPTDPGPSLSSEASIVDEPAFGHLGRVHLVLQPQPDVLEPEPQLQLHARFVEYRGLSEDFVRARANLPVPAWEQLVPGMCVPSESLLPVAAAAPGDFDDERELSMLDAGDLRIILGERELVAPLVLVPDILPWLSGVEYGQVDDRIPNLAFAPDGTAPLTVSVDGSGDGELEAFSMTAIIPVSLTLTEAALDRGRLTIDWRPPSSVSDAMVLRLQAFTGDDGVSSPVGEELTCLVSDTGRATFALAHLVHAGLSVEAEQLRVSASRFDATKVSAGAFGEVEVFIERRTQATLPLARADAR